MKNCLSISLRTSSIKLHEVLVRVPCRGGEAEGVKDGGDGIEEERSNEKDDLHDRSADQQDCLPFGPVQWEDGKQTL
jgi:hypothetical protein